jgi:hypothetical protein
MPRWKAKLRNTLTSRQATPRNMRLGGPRNLGMFTNQKQPSNSEYLRNTIPMPLTLLERIVDTIVGITVATPSQGATVAPVHDVAGTGAPANSTVELWYVQADQKVAEVQSDGSGNWIFGGDTPAALGEITWQVFSGIERSVPITVTVEAVVE